MKLFSSFLLAVKASEFSDIITEVNNANAGWVAGENFHSDTTMDDVKKWLGRWNNKDYDAERPYPNYDAFGDDPIPAEFDARTKWPKCTVIGKVRDQGGCGSCWAFGAAEAISDRICIASDGAVDKMYSAQDIMTCCQQCGNGCGGGYPLAAMDFYAIEGIVTGGLYGDKTTCQPYTLEPCEHHVNGTRPPCTEGNKTPKCMHKCQEGYPTAFKKDKSHGEKGYGVPVDQMQKEIMTFGPVESGFTVFADFPSYKSGVYKHTTGKELGGHAIKIMGWGTENGTDYWLVMNSWNGDWGDKGTFKIARGHNECGIEQDACAAKVRSKTLF